MRRLTRSQEGIALPVATAMLLVISLFVIAFFSVTLQVNETSIEDRSSKRALAAAEAGLQTALYRMNEIGTSDSGLCFTTNWVPEVQTGACPGETDPLGNGASYTYYVTPANAGSCVGTIAGQTERCITSVGTAGGVQRRVQVLANVLTGAISYKSVGLMSNSLMYGGNSSKITSEIGTNGLVQWGNSAETFSNSSADIDGAIIRSPTSPTPQLHPSSKVPVGGWQTVATPYAFPPIDDFDTVKTTATNITTLNWSRPGMTYTASTMTLRVTGGSASLLAGTYYFCRFSMANSAKLTFSQTQQTKIYIDSPSRAGSLCGTQSNPGNTYPVGTFWLENSNEFNKDGKEELVEVFVEGTSYNGTRTPPSFCTPAGDSPHTDKCESDVILVNSAMFEGMIYAPKTTVELNNSGKMKGAIAADKIRFNNSVEFELTDAVKPDEEATGGGIDRGNWVECRPQPNTAADPESGC
jgi:Tfp pilus assembly protein PilX